jgi:glycosyltransferase involved in cell wall biosynthesis
MRLFFNRTFFFYAEYNLRLFLYLLFDNADIYLANDTDTLVANYLAARIRKKPLIFDAHEMFPEVPEVVDRKFVRWFWTKIENWIFPKLTNSYTVCHSIAAVYNTRYAIDMQVVRNIPFSGLPAVPLRPPIDPKGKKVILYQGAVNQGRGIEQVIKAMPLLDDFVFYVVGDGDLLHELKAEVNRLNLDDRVIFTGRVPMEDLPSYTQCASVGVNLLENSGLNYYYALPNRIFDFIRHNIPILASDFPEIRKIITHYNVGMLVENTDPMSLATAIRRLSEWKKSDAAFSIANADLTWEKESAVLLRVVDQAKNQLLRQFLAW